MSADDLAKALGRSSVGSPGFVADHGLWSDEQQAAARDLTARIDHLGLDVVRVGFADTHGIVRSKSLSRRAFTTALANGLDFSLGPFLFDSGQDIVFDPFSPGCGLGLTAMEGAADFLLVPDPQTFKILPWATGTGWILADEFFKDGSPVPFSARHLLRRQLARLRQLDLTMVVGLEIEWYLTRLADHQPGFEGVGGFGRPGTAPSVLPVDLGYQFNIESFSDGLEGVLQPLRQHLAALDLPLRSVEHESGPGQMEFTFEPLAALAAADAMVLIRTAVKQVCRRLGHHATFMCKPALPGLDPSGWHLHQSLFGAVDATNRFMSNQPGQSISALGRHYAGGLVAHAPAACLLTTPSVNGYRRFDGKHTLAPSQAGWSKDNRGAMVRVLAGEFDPSSHLENRIGEPAANPYLYIASQLISGLDGIEGQLDPGPLSDHVGGGCGPILPVSLGEAATALEASKLFRAQAGDALVDYLVAMKRHELNRFEEASTSDNEIVNGVTSWEQREYFGVY